MLSSLGDPFLVAIYDYLFCLSVFYNTCLNRTPSKIP
jgi:hypothetical protein